MKQKRDKFVHLHVHTDGSTLDGLGSVRRLVKCAAEKGFDALAMTDHGTLTNAISFSVACKERNVKSILGEEIYIAFNGKRTGHLTLLAKNKRGFENIIRITTVGHESSYRQPAVTLDTLQEYSNDIICLTGCLASPIHQLESSKALLFASKLKEIFGKSLYGEVIFFNDEDHYSRVVKLSQKLGLKIVVTNDAHFALKSDAEIHPILTTIRMKHTYASSQLWLKTYDELYSYAEAIVKGHDIREWLDVSREIADSIEAIDLSGNPELPSIGKNDFDLLKKKIQKLLVEDAKKFSSDQRSVRIDRAKYELSIVKRMGFSSYFLILKDIVDYARNSGVYVGPGRGSGAGSYLLYLLRITELDPIRYGLQFERFLNPSRIGYPDVDVDLDSEGRQSVIEYAEKKYGAKAVATYAHFSHKTLVHDLSRTLRLNRETESKAADEGIDSDAFKQLVKSHDLFLPAYKVLDDQIRHRGKHAGGIIITSKAVPFERAGDELVVPWTEGGREGDIRELTYAGIVKYDLLGLSALTVLKQLSEVTGESPPEDPDSDKVVLETFCSGDLSGIFQFSGSRGIRDLTVSVAPTCFTDLIAISALYRPGMLNSGLTWKYKDFKRSPRKLHDNIDEILEETYGIMVFQEQMMSVYAKISGGSLAEADNARRVLTKDAYAWRQKDPAWMAKVDKIKKPFFENGLRNGFDRKFLDKMWAEIFDHSLYSFNRSHAAAYSMVAWRMAWYKRYFPAEFYAASMHYDRTNFQTYLFDAIRAGIAVVPPDINTATAEFKVKNGNIYLPISSAKFMAERGVEAIINERNRRGIFKSFADFRNRIPRNIVNSRACQSLYASGGMNLKGNPSEVGIDVAKIPQMSKMELQNLYLGAVLPTREMVDTIRKLSEIKNVRAGILLSKKRKESKFGSYTVYSLSPSGTFWIRDAENDFDIDTGQFLIVKVRESSGKALSVKKLKHE